MRLQVTQVAAGVHRLASRYENWYLLEQGGRLTILDAGLPAHWDPFLAALEARGYGPSDIDAVLITHHHPDHAGNAERLRATGAAVWARSADRPHLRGEVRQGYGRIVRYVSHPWYARYLAYLLASRVTRTPAMAEVNELADGEVLDVPGAPRVLHAPGHTAGSCALWLEGQSLLFSGDALVTLDMTRGRTGPRIIRDPVTEDADRALEALNILAGTRAETVLPGHGEPWTDGVESAAR